MVSKLCRRSSLFESMIELIQPMAVIAVMATLPLLLRWVGHFEVRLTGWIRLSLVVVAVLVSVVSVVGVGCGSTGCLCRVFGCLILLIRRPCLLWSSLASCCRRVRQQTAKGLQQSFRVWFWSAFCLLDFSGLTGQSSRAVCVSHLLPSFVRADYLAASNTIAERPTPTLAHALARSLADPPSHPIPPRRLGPVPFLVPFSG